ncbi:restriction endonuclease subunit S [Vibrio owensii]|uniref:restriction endonuclease subunit S n=1 Tax=Vibrio owensii TaxID=696485 RepID=UPI002F423062
MVPNGWNKKKLGELCYLNPKKPSKPDDGIVSFIAMQQLSESGKVISTDSRSYDDVSKGFTSFVDKDVLVAKITPCFENGKGALVDNLANGIGFGSTEFHVLRAKKGTHPEYIYYLTRTKELRVRGEMNMQGSAGHRRVTADYFNAYKVLTPPLPEQRKIAQILSTWDRGIAITEKLIDASKQQKKALIQQLLTGKKRFKDQSGNEFPKWINEPIGKYLASYKELVPANTEIPVLTSSRTGLYIQERSVINEGDYGVLPLGYFTYRHMSDDLIFKFNVNRTWKRGAVSKEYPVFKTVGLDSRFLESQLNEGNDFKRFAVQQKQGGTRTRLYFKNLKELKLNLPCLDEQQKIASVLTAADKEIELLEAKLAHLKQEKKALMQQLLTGKRRVKVPDTEVA